MSVERTILFLDLETNNNPYFGAVASPRHPENWPVMIGTASESVPYAGEVQTQHYPQQADVPDVWLNIPDTTWLIVAHNAPYEMDWFLHLQRPQIMAYLKRGGRIFCTALAEYLLSNQQNTYPALEETAPTYGGTRKVDGIKMLWNQGVLTKDIDPVLLKEYLSGPEGDVVNTRLTFYGQYQKLVERGMLGMALERMESLIFNTLAMDAGLLVDPEVAKRQQAEGEAKLAELDKLFESYRSHIPAHCNFNTGSDFHMSAWLFGGPIKYTGKTWWDDKDGNPAYEKADFVKDDRGWLWPVDAEKQIITHWPLAEGQTEYALHTPTNWEVWEFDSGHKLERYKSGKNKGQVKVLREDTPVRRTKNAPMLQPLGPIVDLNLLPADLRKEFEKEFTGKRMQADDTPVYSTGKDALEMLSKRPEFPEGVRQVLASLMEWAKIDKDMGTYYLREERDDNGVVVKQSGMLKYMNEKNIVNHSLNATATVTTRLSSNNPNLQNIPRGGTSDVKKMFVSRFGKDGYIMEADYSALEVVTMCAFTKDKALTKALLDGTDMHCLRLAKALKETYEGVLDKAKNQEHPDFVRYDDMRTKIKPKAFSYQYGATAHGIAFSTGCTVAEAQEFIDTEKALFPEVEAWFDPSGPVVTQVRETSTSHREQMDNGSYRMYQTGYWQAPGGTCYEFRQYPKSQWVNGVKQELMTYKMTQIRNYPIQGESGFFVQGIAGRIARWLIANDFFPDEHGNPRVYIINTVHDAYYFDVHYSVLDVVGAGVKALMESLPQYFNENFGYDLHVPFPAAVEFGRSMHEKIHWHPGVLSDPKIREKLGLPPLE